MKIDKITGDTTYQIELTEHERVCIREFLSTASMYGDVSASITRSTKKGCGENCMETVNKFRVLIGDTKASKVENQDYDYYDPKTGLEWLVILDSPISWKKAKGLVNILKNNWRMPTVEESKSLFRKGFGAKNMPSEIAAKTTGWFVWSDELKEDDKEYARYFSFENGVDDWSFHGTTDGSRAFAVRPRE